MGVIVQFLVSCKSSLCYQDLMLFLCFIDKQMSVTLEGDINAAKSFDSSTQVIGKWPLFFLSHFNPYPANIFVLKMLSAYYICCIYSNAFQATLSH